MMYLSGAKGPRNAAAIASGDIGLMLTPNTGYRLDNVAVWALDNGCFTNAYPGDDAYIALLDRLRPWSARCLFATAPDVVGDAAATLELFAQMGDRIRGRGYPVALVAQDGLTDAAVPWDHLDWLFLGGTDSFKLSETAAALIAAAKRRGVRVHVGRVNSERRLRWFAARDADSADGTVLAFDPARVDRVRGWIARANQPRLWQEALP